MSWEATSEEGFLLPLPLGHGLLVLGCWLWFEGKFLSHGKSGLLFWWGFNFSIKVSVLGFSIQILLLLCVNSLTPMDGRDRPLLNEFCGTVIRSQSLIIFFVLLHSTSQTMGQRFPTRSAPRVPPLQFPFHR